MGRLTVDGVKFLVPMVASKSELCGEIIRHQKYYDRLCEYENVGLTLDEIQQLQKENAELKARFGKAVELPCKVGDTVYFEAKGYDHWHTYQNFIQKQEITMIILRNDFIKFQTASKTYYLEDFGKTVFLTKEEAIKKLKENE